MAKGPIIITVTSLLIIILLNSIPATELDKDVVYLTEKHGLEDESNRMKYKNSNGTIVYISENKILKNQIRIHVMVNGVFNTAYTSNSGWIVENEDVIETILSDLKECIEREKNKVEIK